MLSSQTHKFPNSSTIWSVDLRRLQIEKDFLENRLADCVTYLQSFRKKQAGNERRLAADPSLPRKKKKKLHQNTRELVKEIRDYGQEERALLNNLQACKANIYIVETLQCPSITQSSTIPDAMSVSTCCSIPEESEDAEHSWTGWTDEALVSPFQKQSINPFFASEVAPDDCFEERKIAEAPSKDMKRPPLNIRTDKTFDALVPPVPPNTAISQRAQIVLRPEADEFQPYCTGTPMLNHVLNGPDITGARVGGGSKDLQARRATDGGVDQAFKHVSLHHKAIAEEEDFHVRCNIAPRLSLDKAADRRWVGRRRTGSY